MARHTYLIHHLLSHYLTISLLTISPLTLPAVPLARAIAARHLLDDAVPDAPFRGGIEHGPAVDEAPAAGERHALVEHDAVARARQHEPRGSDGRVVDVGARVALLQDERAVVAQIDAVGVGERAGQEPRIAVARH